MMINIKDHARGKLFSDDIQKKIRERFDHVDNDPVQGHKRLFFENAGGSLRLKKAKDNFAYVDSIPDCPERTHDTARYLRNVIKEGKEDLKIILNASGGAILTELTASKVMFNITGAIADNVPGNNIVSTVLEHPSSFDASRFYAQKNSKELRVAGSNRISGGVDAEEILKLIDDETCLLSIIYASNISGTVLDIERIVKEARDIKPDIFIIVDAVQHVPHGFVDFEKLGIDGVTFAPYKFFGCRGIGFGYVSDRVAELPHHKLEGREDNIWELGSPAPGHFAVLTEIVNYVTWIGSLYIAGNDRRALFVEGMNRIRLHERALMDSLLYGSKNMPGLINMDKVNVYFQTPDHSNKDLILAISIDGIGISETVEEFKKKGVLVFERVSCSIYSKRMLDSFNLKGCVRVSPLHCHNKTDIEAFLRVTKEIIEKIL